MLTEQMSIDHKRAEEEAKREADKSGRSGKGKSLDLSAGGAKMNPDAIGAFINGG